jgi:hypothetical protein
MFSLYLLVYVQGRINQYANYAMVWGPPPGSGGPPRRQKNYIYALQCIYINKRIAGAPGPPGRGPPRSFGMGPPNVLIRACIRAFMVSSE